MAEPMPWENDPIVAAPANSTRGPLYGPAPKAPPGPTPFQIEDQEAQREERRRQALVFNAERNPDGTKKPTEADAKLTEAERTAGFLTKRIVDSVGQIATTAQKDRSALAPTLGVEAVRTVFGNSAANYITDADRQQVRASQLDILDAALTLGTGAAYTKEQLENYRESYFPVLGDDPTTVSTKNTKLRSLLESARIKAGNAAPEMDRAIAALDALNAPAAPTKVKNPDGTESVIYSEEGEGLTGGGVTDDSPNLTPEQEIQVAARADNVDAVGAGMYGIADTVTLGFADEMAAGLNAAFGSGGGSFGQRYTSNLNVERAARDRIRDSHSGAYFTGQIGGALVPLSRAKGLLSVGQTAKLGAAQGAAYGAGSADGDFGSRVTGGVLGAGLGAAGGALAGYAVPKAVGALSSVVNNPVRVAERQAQIDARAGAQPIIEAARAEGVPITRPIVDPTVRNAVTALETTPQGNPIIRQSLHETSDALEKGVERLGGGGTPRDTAGVGEVVQNAGQRFIDRSRTVAGRMYRRAENLAGDASASPKRAIQALDRHIDELKASGENANGPQISYLEGLREDLGRGPMSIDALRNLRSQMRGQINSRNLTATDAERRVGEVLTEASQDIEAALASKPEALRAYRRADQFYRQRQTYISDVLQRFMGRRDKPLSAEQAFSKLETMAGNRGDSRRLAEAMRALDPAEAVDVAATFAERLGRDAAGNFSPALLATQAEKLSPRARQTIFGPDGARSLNNLMAVAREFRDVSANLNNSRTGVANNYRSWLGRTMGLVGAGAGFASSGGVAALVGGMAAKTAGQAAESVFDARNARLLMSSDFTSWLRSAPATASSGAINRHAAKLERIATRTPYLAADIQSLQGRLIEAARMSGPSAADEKSEPRPAPE